MDQLPGFACALPLEFTQRHDGALRMLEASRHRSAKGRLSLAPEHLIRNGRAGAVDARGWRFVRTTQAELANLSRQTVNGLVGELAAQQRLRAGYGGPWVPAPRDCETANQAASAASMSLVMDSGASLGA